VTEGSFVAFRYADFRFVFAGRILAATGEAMLQIAVGWEMWRITSDPFVLGLIGLALFLPNLVFFLPAGIAADRYPRRLVLIASYGLQAAAALLLAFIFHLGAPPIEAVLPVLFLVGMGRTFAAPAGQALVPNVVPPEHFPNALAWGNSTWELSVIVGPMLGGALLFAGAPLVCMLVAVALLGNTACMALLKTRSQVLSDEPVNLRTVLAGLSYIRRREIILGAVTLDLFAVLLGGATALLPAYATDVLDIGEVGLGLLRSSLAVGAVVSGLVIVRFPVRRNAGRTLLITVGLFGVAILIFGLSQIIWLSVAALALAGACDMVSVYIRQTLIQLATPDEMRGRVSAVTMMFVGASNELGEFRAGTVAAMIGIVASVVVGGAGTMTVAALWALVFPKLRRVDRLEAGSLSED
jgi:MFS family permease